ncbi:MAG TPA: DUF5054 domain-containing protein [Bryobacteraceae bacterium]|jgi:hypothetical protein
MRRRQFVGSLLAASGATFAAVEAPDPSVRRVLVMFKCHLDVGFIDTQANIIKKYFEQYFPLAMETAATLKKHGNDRYVWTTGSWLIYEYLERAAPAARARMEQALRSGDIAWHGIPFTWQTELMDRSLIAGGLGLAKSLDRRFGRTTTGAKMTDVPGHTRALIGPLAEQGIKLLDIGVNSASTPPDVPPLFVWKDAAGHSIIIMYHRTEYGGVVKVPGSDLAIDVEVRDDNAGPHTIEEIHAIHAGLRKRFPNASVTATDLTTIANAVEPYRAKLPVIENEIGDTWIYGIASDPTKVARYREMARLRDEWIKAGKLHVGDATDLKFLSPFLLEVEHTWGTDTKTWLDFDHYTPRDLASMLGQPKYQVVLGSWKEKRQDLYDAVATLPAPLKDEATARLKSLHPVEPATTGLTTHPPQQVIDTKHFTLALDPTTGAISRLHSKKTGREWATAQSPLALFSYQTLAKSDYDRFFKAYLKSDADWAPKDFGKPNIDRFGAESRTWHPQLKACHKSHDAQGHRIVAQLAIDDAKALASGRTAWPSRMFLELLLPDNAPVVDILFSWFGKPANRMPEGLWMTFQPPVADPRKWLLEKSGSSVSPFDVISGGNRAMHAVIGGLNYQEGPFRIETLDAPLVTLGERLAVHFTRDQPDLKNGFHFSLFNNGWGTNYVQWFGEDMTFRFRIRA